MLCVCVCVLQVGTDPLVKAVLQAFQMSLSCCMERSHLPMMRHQLVLRLMAAAQAASATANTPVAAAIAASRSSSSLRMSCEVGGRPPTAGTEPSVLATENSAEVLPSGRTAEGAAFLAAALNIAAVIGSGAGPSGLPTIAAGDAGDDHAPRMSLHSNSSAGGSAASFTRQQAEYATEMQGWYRKQYAACCVSGGLLWPRALMLQQLQLQQGQQQQQQGLLPPHLMGYTPSLQQAGGRHRMALRGHLGPIRRVVISPSGKDVLTASDDGGVQVGCR